MTLQTRVRIAVGLAALGIAHSAAAVDLNGGTWQVMNPPQRLLTSAGKPPPLLPEALAAYRSHAAARKTGDLSFDDTEKCMPPGMPRILTMPGSLGRFEFLQRADQVVITYEWNRVWRLVPIGQRPEYIAPQYAGRSVGRWTGNTLTIDSTDYVGSSLLDNDGMPHSDELHMTERYTPSSDGRHMELRLRIEDPKTFSTPWETSLTLTHDAHGRLAEDECVERRNSAWARVKDGA